MGVSGFGEELGSRAGTSVSPLAHFSSDADSGDTSCDASRRRWIVKFLSSCLWCLGVDLAYFEGNEDAYRWAERKYEFFSSSQRQFLWDTYPSHSDLATEILQKCPDLAYVIPKDLGRSLNTCLPELHVAKGRQGYRVMGMCKVVPVDPCGRVTTVSPTPSPSH